MEGMTITEINQFFFDNFILPPLAINVHIHVHALDANEDWINERLIPEIEMAMWNG